MRPDDRLQRPVSLRSRFLRHPVLCRPRTTDINVFNQIFLHREYRCLDDVQDVGLIIDCGANVGFSAAYFLSRFERSFVIAVEPDPENFAALQVNLSPYKGRHRSVCSGVWSRRVGLVLAGSTLGPGQEWGRTVREVLPDEQPMMMAIDVGSLLSGSGFERISVLKIDIEGSEAEVFAANYESSLGKVDNMVIECHGHHCVRAVTEAVSTQKFQMSRCDELLVFRRRGGGD